MSRRHGIGPDGIWRIGPVRLLMVVGASYLAVVLALTAINSHPDGGPSPAADAAGGSGVPTDVPQPSDDSHRDDAGTLPADPSPATPGAGDVRVGSVENRSPAPRAPQPPATPRPTTQAPGPAGPPVVTSYEAESPANGLANTKIYPCSGCSGLQKVGRIGAGMGTLRFNGVTARTGGRATVTVAYVNGEAPRVGQLSVNGESPITVTFPHTGGWSSVGTMTVTLSLRPGSNTLTMSNPSSAAPDFDKITVSVR